MVDLGILKSGAELLRAPNCKWHDSEFSRMICPLGRLFTSLPFNKIWPRLWPRGWYFDFSCQVGSQLGELLWHWQVFPRSRDGSGRSGFLQSWISEEFCWMLVDVLEDKCDEWRVKCGGTQTSVRVRAVVCSQTRNSKAGTSKRFYSWNIHMAEHHLIPSEWKTSSHWASGLG